MLFPKMMLRARGEKGAAGKRSFRESASSAFFSVCRAVKTPGRWALLLLLFGGLLISSCGAPPLDQSQEPPVEPLVADRDDILSGELFMKGRYAVVNPEKNIYSLSISSLGNNILFSTDTRAVNMLDEEGRLLWEMHFEGLPINAALTEDGRYSAVGTEKGKVYFLQRDGHILWEEQFGGSIDYLTLSQGGEYLLLSVQKEEEDAEGRAEKERQHLLYLFDQRGELLWQKETSPIVEAFLFSEEKFYYLQKEDDGNRLVALVDGEVAWDKKASLASFCGSGDFAALFCDGRLLFYSLKGGHEPALLWERSMETEISWLDLTESGERVFAYSSFRGAGSNIFVYHRDSTLLWEKRIPGGALLQVSRFGERTVVSSWQEYSEDFTNVMVIDIEGKVLQEVEMASRIEKMALSGSGRSLALAGSDGTVFILGIPLPGISRPSVEEGGENDQGQVIYRPVVFDKSADEIFITLYFFDEGAARLIPVNRRIPTTSAVLQAAVNELIKGPPRLSGLSRTIPKDAEIKVALKEGTAYMDLPEELDRLGGSTQASGIIDSLVLTASQFPYVRGVRFLIEGEQARTFGSEGLLIDRVFPPQRPASTPTMMYLPYRSGERYYLLPREVPGDKRGAPEELVATVLASSRFYLSDVPELYKIRVLRDEIIMDWSSCFKNLFPVNGDAESMALAQLFVDSLLLTLADNLPPDRLVFLVEGKPWQPPGYPPLNRELKRPFYINPQ